MDWMDFDRNGVVDGVDFFILNEIFEPSKKKEKDTDSFWEDEPEEDEADLW